MSGRTRNTVREPEPRSPWTPFNASSRRTEKRKLVGGRWVRPDPQAAMTLAWLKAEHPQAVRA